MTTKKSGHLNKKAILKAKTLCNNHKSLLNFVHKINNYAEKIKTDLAIHKQNSQEIICACLFMRILEGSQAAILLIERGFDLDTSTTLRSIFEALVYLKLCCQDKRFTDEYLLLHEATRLELIYKAQKNPDDLHIELLRSNDDKRTIDVVIKEIKANLSTQKISAENIKEVRSFLSKFKKRELADKAGFLNHYRTFYYETSNTAHISPKGLTRYLEINDNGKLIQFNHGPCGDHARLHLITIADIEIATLALISHLFDLTLDQKINKLQLELKSF